MISPKGKHTARLFFPSNRILKLPHSETLPSGPPDIYPVSTGNSTSLHDISFIFFAYDLNSILSIKIGVCLNRIPAFHNTVFNMCIVSKINII